VCGGLAGMIAKVRVNWGCVCCCDDERASVTHWQDGHCLTVLFSLSLSINNVDGHESIGTH
jgi:hypothetical protein